MKKALVFVLVLGLLGSVVFAAGEGETASDKPVKITIGTIYAPDHPANIAAEEAIKEIEEKSGGSIIVELFPSAQLGNNTELANGMVSGSVDMNIQSMGFFIDKLPEAEIDSFFFAYRDTEHVYKVWDGEIGDWFKEELLKAYGVRILDPWLYGTRVMTTSKTPINSPADLEGLKMRVPPAPAWIDMMNAFGANATPVAFPELYMALSQNVVDGQENPIPTIISAKFHEVQGYLSLTNHKFETIYVMVNEEKWASLTDTQRSIIETAFLNAREVNNSQIEKQTTDGLDEFRAAGGIVVENPDRQAFADIVSDLIASDYPHLSELYDRIRAVE